MSGAAISIREKVLQAVQAALSASGSPAANVFRSTVDQIEQDDLPAFAFNPGDEGLEDPGAFGDKGSVTRTLAVEVRAVVNAGECDDSALDPFYIFAVQQLAGGGADLGGLVLEVVEKGKSTVFRPNGQNILGLEMHFDLIFATKRGDPTTKG